MMPFGDKLREECGVFGIRTAGAGAAAYVHLGLYALQHRGQESAGIATFDGAKTHLVKDMGLVGTIFTPSGWPGSPERWASVTSGTRRWARSRSRTPSRSWSRRRGASSRSRTTAT